MFCNSIRQLNQVEQQTSLVSAKECLKMEILITLMISFKLTSIGEVTVDKDPNTELMMLSKFKVENILKGSLDSTPSPSPSVKIQIMGGKVCLRCKGKILLGIVNKLLKTKKFVDITQQCFTLLPQINFPANNLNFH